DLAFEIGPGQSLGLDPDAGILRLETTRDVVECLDRLWLGFRVPDAHELFLRHSRRGDADGQCGRERDHPRHVHECPPLNAFIRFQAEACSAPLASCTTPGAARLAMTADRG